MCQIVAYYRVSTAKQGQSGLGLDAQRDAVMRFASSEGKEVIGEFVEVESGKVDDRPQLSQALDQCELTGARLVIAKLDRLSRNVAFLANLLDSGVKFVAADNPQANELTIHILAAVAQAERKAISVRTKSALAAAKARGVKLGNPRLEEARAKRNVQQSVQKATSARVSAAKERAVKVMRAIEKASESGAGSLQEIADYLNNTAIRTPRGAMWTRAAVSRVIKQAGADFDELKLRGTAQLSERYGSW